MTTYGGTYQIAQYFSPRTNFCSACTRQPQCFWCGLRRRAHSLDCKYHPLEINSGYYLNIKTFTPEKIVLTPQPKCLEGQSCILQHYHLNLLCSGSTPVGNSTPAQSIYFQQTFEQKYRRKLEFERNDCHSSFTEHSTQ